MRAAARHILPSVTTSSAKLNPMPVGKLFAGLKVCCPGWDWKQPRTTPLDWDKAKWEHMFEECGFGIVQFASGEKLREIQDKIRRQWNDGVKEAIVNRQEWVSKEPSNKERCWTAVEQDAGRLQVHLESNADIAGADIIQHLYPALEPGTTENKPCVRMGVILGNHPAATAQQFHWDRSHLKQYNPRTKRTRAASRKR